MNEVRYLFVDGYNVINSWEELRQLKDTDLEEARYKLIDMMIEYVTLKGLETYVVFDAHYVKGSFEKREKYKNINIVYTKEGESADCFIEKNIKDMAKKGVVAVVTSDYLEQRIIFQMGGIRITPNEFLSDIKNSKKIVKEKTTLKYTDKKNSLEQNIDEKTLRKLEKIRRNL